jgi:putative copper export protein
MRVVYLLSVYVHIVTVAVWFGAMLFEDPASVRLMSRMAYRIHGIGTPSLVVLILTGTFMAFYRGVTWQSIVGGQFFATTYGQVFGVKLFLVLVLVGFQITIGNRPSKLVYGYLLAVLSIIALSVWLVRPIV